MTAASSLFVLDDAVVVHLEMHAGHTLAALGDAVAGTFSTSLIFVAWALMAKLHKGMSS
jgi:hypothetical protein